MKRRNMGGRNRMDHLMMQWLSIQKMAMDNSFQSMARLQDYFTRQVVTSFEKNPALPAEGIKLVIDWVESYRRGFDELKARVDENYKKAEAFFDKNN
jgi:hypothetical protein